MVEKDVQRYDFIAKLAQALGSIHPDLAADALDGGMRGRSAVTG